MNITKRTWGVGVLAGLLALGVGGTAQAADPVTPSDTALVAVGSDTTQDVMDGLAAAIGGGQTIFNYKAAGGGTVTTRSAAHPNCAAFHRPNGSGDGKNALQSAVGNQAVGANYPTALRGTGGVLCVDVARSSSSSFPAAPAGATGQAYRRYAFATDSVSYATLQSTAVAKKLSIADLKKYYAANGNPGTSACFNKRPLIPQSGSGTRQFWASVMGVTDTLLSDPTVGTTGRWGTCVRDTTDGVIGSANQVQEHVGTALTTGQSLVPFSVAQFIAQAGGVADADLRGNASLGSIDWTASAAGATSTTNAVAPMVLQPAFGSGTRTIYNFVAKDAAVSGNTAGTGVPFNPLVAQTFEGASSSVCTNTAVIQRYGFASLGAACGAVTDGP